ncbi:MAG: porin family protein [Tannerella sp.]|nr:porin family protein [Tannerella sp.]
MRRLLCMALVALGCMSVNAQNAFNKGDKVISLGVGLGDFIGGSGYSTSIPPIALSGEVGIVDGLINDRASIGVGGYVAYLSKKYEQNIMSTTLSFDYTYIIFGARGAFHYQFVDKLDTYAGVLLGYNAASVDLSDGDSSYKPDAAGGIAYATYVGAKYYFTPNFAAYAELGYGIAALELGVAIKF